MSDVDYLRLAKINIEDANGKPSTQSTRQIAAAQVYATIALVEQVARLADTFGESAR